MTVNKQSCRNLSNTRIKALLSFYLSKVSVGINQAKLEMELFIKYNFSNSDIEFFNEELIQFSLKQQKRSERLERVAIRNDKQGTRTQE